MFRSKKKQKPSNSTTKTAVPDCDRYAYQEFQLCDAEDGGYVLYIASTCSRWGCISDTHFVYRDEIAPVTQLIGACWALDLESYSSCDYILTLIKDGNYYTSLGSCAIEIIVKTDPEIRTKYFTFIKDSDRIDPDKTSLKKVADLGE